MLKRIKKAIKNPKLILLFFLNSRIFRLLPDDLYLKIKYRLTMGRKLDLNNPETFNQKLQWLKLYDRKPEYTQMVDKYEVRKYIKEIIGEEYLIPLLGVYDSFEEIDFDNLPDEFVLKPNHTSGNVFICKDKSKIDYKKLKKEVNRWLKREYYWLHREWPYKNVKPRIICEELIKTENGGFPYDYKFHCFNGEPDNVMVCIERESGNPKFYFFDNEWNLLRYNLAGINAPQGFTLPKPKKMDEMFMLAKKLSSGFPFIRVDFFCENEKIYFGELTFFPASGFDVNLLKETDILFGEKLELDK
ncbi:MAG TPA: ATP-grasp fold amidoligase family protein [Bacilli bacterium]|nr:ATP-grasp fold amidoligase family protein [Bacilli bacterium]